jgi:peptidoglycan/LPS O-acetylase OafA/YrhL
MTMRTTSVDATGRDVRRVLLATLVILLVPAVAMRFTDEVDWGPGDFLVGGALLAGSGLAYVFAARRVGRPPRRLLLGGSLGLALLLVWAELAVGIFH